MNHRFWAQIKMETMEEDEKTKINKKLRAALRNLCTCSNVFFTLYGQPRLQPPTSWPKGLEKNELLKLYSKGYWLASRDYPSLVVQEKLLYPSAYGEDVTWRDVPGASTYPIGIKWYHDPNGNWGLTSISTAKTRNDHKWKDGEAFESKLTKDIPRGKTARYTVSDDIRCPKCGDVFSSEEILELHTCGFDVEKNCTNLACPRGVAARLTEAEIAEAEKEVTYPLVVQAPGSRGVQDEQEAFFQEVRSKSRARAHAKRLLIRNKLTPISGPEEDETMPDLESNQEGASQKDDRRVPRRPTNSDSYPKRRKRATRGRKNSGQK